MFTDFCFVDIFSSRKRKLESFLVFSLISAVVLFGRDFFLASIISDPEALVEVLGSYGYAGIILTQFAQVLIAPLPPITPVVSGMLYGVFIGTSLSFIGAAFGSLAALLIAKRFGRPAVRKFLSDEAMERFDDFIEGHGYLPFVVLFVFPGFPDDSLCFIAGLTPLDWKKLFLIASFGRIPGIALLATTGSSAAQANVTVFLISASAVLIISLLSVKYKQEIEHFLLHLKEKVLYFFRRSKKFWKFS